MQHLQGLLAMRKPTTTPISSATPTSSHLLRVSRDLLASAAAPRPKTSAKQSWIKKSIHTKIKLKGEGISLLDNTQCLEVKNFQLGPKIMGTFEKTFVCALLKMCFPKKRFLCKTNILENHSVIILISVKYNHWQQRLSH